MHEKIVVISVRRFSGQSENMVLCADQKNLLEVEPQPRPNLVSLSLHTCNQTLEILIDPSYIQLVLIRF